MFSCGDGKCIYQSLMCDGKGDCGNNMDEDSDCSGNNYQT